MVDRANVIHTMVLAEMTHFNRVRRTDFKVMFQEYLEEKIKFHEQIANMLKDAKAQFDGLPF